MRPLMGVGEEQDLQDPANVGEIPVLMDVDKVPVMRNVGEVLALTNIGEVLALVNVGEVQALANVGEVSVNVGEALRLMKIGRIWRQVPSVSGCACDTAEGPAGLSPFPVQVVESCIRL